MAFIAVNQNERLDYFGSTVNIACRLADFSAGDDVIVSGEVLDYLDSEQSSFLVQSASAEPFETRIKGFDAENFKVWRIRTNKTVTQSRV